MSKQIINTDKAPAAIGTYSQAVKAGNTVYISGQIPLDPETMEVVDETLASLGLNMRSRMPMREFREQFE